MSDYMFTLPLSVILPRKTKKDRKVSINLNWFRHAHHRDYDKAKVIYAELVKEQLTSVDGPIGKIHIQYDYYAAMNNSPDLDNFVGAAKKFFQDAMVKHGFIPEDNVNVIVSSSDAYKGIDRKNPRIEARITVLDLA